MTDSKITYERKVRTLRVLRGWSQQELARQAGIDRRSVVLMEGGSSGTRVRQAVEEAFGLDMEAPAVELAFVVLGSDGARAAEVRLALAVLNGAAGVNDETG